eukprot:2102992-Pleurochrysis_carterae.AAC.2
MTKVELSTDLITYMPRSNHARARRVGGGKIGAGTGWTDDEGSGPGAPRRSVGAASDPPTRQASRALSRANS